MAQWLSHALDKGITQGPCWTVYYDARWPDAESQLCSNEIREICHSNPAPLCSDGEITREMGVIGRVVAWSGGVGLHSGLLELFCLIKHRISEVKETYSQ